MKIRKTKILSSEATSASPGAVTMASEGRSRIDAVVASARDIPWGLTVLQLLWTAGPVTYVALQGGHFLGFGRAAPAETFIYFAVYTMLFGVIGLLARFVASVRGRRQDRAARYSLTFAIDRLSDLLFATRDIGLSQLSPAERRLEAASVLLRKADLGPRSVALAVQELTNDSYLAETVERIEIYRRLGMNSRVKDLVDFSAEQRALALKKIHITAPEIADVLRDRLTGVGPSQEYGVPRRENFIEHVLVAADQDDLQLMTLADADELLVLAFELINNREIVRLSFEYQGDWGLARALDDVENARNEYRATHALVLSYLHDLIDVLVDSPHVPEGEATLYLPPEKLMEITHTAFIDLIQKLHQPQTKERHESIKQSLRQAFRPLKLIIKAAGKLGREYDNYGRALRNWENLRQREFQDSLHGTFILRRKFGIAFPDRRKRGLRIIERSIRLPDKEKVELAQAFCQYMDELNIEVIDQRLFRDGTPITESDAKRLAIRLALALEPLIQLSRADVQRAIYGSNAAYLGGMENWFSADAKAGMGAAVVKEVKQDMGRASEQLALRLTHVYHVPLNEGMIDFLATTYGANRDRLDVLASSRFDYEEELVPTIPPRPAITAIDSTTWKTMLQNIQRLLET